MSQIHALQKDTNSRDMFASNQIPNSKRISDADLLLNLHSPYNTAPHMSSNETTTAAPAQPGFKNMPNPLAVQEQLLNQDPQESDVFAMPYGNMMIENQDIDVSALMSDDMMWLEYFPRDLMDVIDPEGSGAGRGD
jgi:hypothetical protein